MITTSPSWYRGGAKPLRWRMKKMLIFVLAGWMFLLGMGPPPVLAAGSASLTFSGTTIEMKEGTLLDLPVIVNANGETLDTVRIELSFPAELLQVDHVTLGSLFPRQAPGNVVDNVEGKLSQGAFTVEEPVTTSGTFGVVVFKALKSGTATVRILETSHLISNGEEKGNSASFGTTQVNIAPATALEETLPTLTIFSSTHPDTRAWYSVRDGLFNWQLSGEGTLQTVWTAFDALPTTDPTENAVREESTKAVAGIQDGVWYFHAQGRLADGRATQTAHYKVQIDGTPPNSILPSLDQDQFNEGTSVKMAFGTTDDLSGIRRYEVAMNGGSFQEEKSPMSLEMLPPGTYQIEVKAVDQAGNATYGQTAARVYPKDVILPSTIASDEAMTQPTSSTDREEKTFGWLLQKDRTKLLITFVLVIAAILGIIYANRKKK